MWFWVVFEFPVTVLGGSINVDDYSYDSNFDTFAYLVLGYQYAKS